jgi:hypothetical protein
MSADVVNGVLIYLNAFLMLDWAREKSRGQELIGVIVMLMITFIIIMSRSWMRTYRNNMIQYNREYQLNTRKAAPPATAVLY